MALDTDKTSAGRRATAGVATAARAADETFDAAAQALIDAARAAEAQGPDRAIDAWRKACNAAPKALLPRRELARLLRGAQRWNALVDTLKELVARLDDGRRDEKVATLYEMADVYRDHIKLDVMVVQTLNQILAAAPGEARALDLLESQYEASKRWLDLIGVLQKKAAAIADRDARIALYQRIAGLYSERFNNDAEAIKAYEKILELDAEHAATLTTLRERYERRRDWDKLVAVLGRQVELEGDPAARLARRVELARLASDKIKKSALSIDLWNQVLAEGPDHAEALASLEKLFEREKQWEELAAVLERQVETAGDRNARANLLQKLGGLYGEKVGDPRRAIEPWRRLLAEDPQNRRALDALKKLYQTARMWDELEALHADAGRWDDLIRLLERQAETEPALETKVEIHLRCGRIWQERLGKDDKAARAYEKVLLADPEHLGAAEALLPLYEAAGDHRRLAGALEVQLRHTADRRARIARLRRLTDLYAGELKDDRGACVWLRQAFQEDPGAAWAREGYERLAPAAGLVQELAADYEAALAQVASPASRVPLLATLARVYQDPIGDDEAAIRAARALLELDAGHAGALAALERLYAAREAWDELLGVIERQLQAARGNEETIARLERLAAVYETMGQPEMAIAPYQRILELAGEHLPTLRALDRIYTALGMTAELFELLPRALAAVPAGDAASAAELKFRLATLELEQRGDRGRALALCGEILAEDPDHGGARAVIEELLDEPALQLEAARVLVPVYQRAGAHAPLVRAHEVLIARDPEPAARVARLLEVGALWDEQLGDPERAFAAWARAFREDPESAAARAALEQSAVAQADVGRLVALYEDALDRRLPPELARELLLRVASIHDGVLGQADRAMELYARVLDLEPGDLEALDALDSLYTQHERYEELAEVLRRRLAGADDPQIRLDLHFRLAALLDETLQDPDAAVAAYRAILDEAPDEPAALRALDRLYAGRGLHGELRENLARQIEAASDERERVGLLERLAALLQRELNERAAALATWQQVLGSEAGRGAHHDAAVRALEELLADPEVAVQAAAQLEPVYRARDDAARLTRVYEILVESEGDPGRRIDLWHRVAELRERQGDGDGAFRTLGRALRERPEHAATRREIERAARAQGSWDDLVALYVTLGDEADRAEEEVRVELLMRAAQLLEQQLADPIRAAQTYRRVLDVKADCLEAANALEQIYLAQDAFGPLVEVLLHRADVVAEVGERKELLSRAAQICEDVLEDRGTAIDVYRRVLDLDGADRVALESLERLYVDQGRWADLEGVYARRAALSQGPDEKKQHLYVLGQVHDRELNDPVKAIETYQQVLAIDPDDEQAVQALERLYMRTERWYDLLPILEWEVAHAHSTAETVAIHHRMGQVWEKQLGDVGRAVEAYRAALALDPGHPSTLDALEGILHGSVEPVMAAEVLEPIFRGLAEWEKLIDVLEVRVTYSQPAERVGLLAKIAVIAERELASRDRAFRALARAAVEEIPAEGLLDELERLAAETGRWGEVVKLYEEQVDKFLEPSRQADLLVRAGRILARHMDRPEDAVREYRAALDVDPDRQDALADLDELYTRIGRWADLAEVLRRSMRFCEEGPERTALQFRLAEVHEQRLGDVVAAVDGYRDVLAREPAHEGAVAALERLYRQDHLVAEIAAVLEPLYRAEGHWDRLVHLLEARLATVADVVDRYDLMRTVAALAERELADPVLAFHWWGRALRERPDESEPADEMERLAAATGAYEELAALYGEIVAESGLHPESRRGLLWRAAQVCERELRDPARAESAYRQILEQDPNDAGALASLDRVYVATGRSNELAGVLQGRIDLSTDLDEKVQLLLRLGAILDEGGNGPAATDAFRQALAIDPRCLRAFEALEALQFRRHQWRELLATYEGMVEVLAGDGERAAAWANMARVAADALDDRARALELWNRVLEVRGADPTAFEALADLHEAAGDAEALVDVLQRHVAVVEDTVVRVPLIERLGHALHEKLSRSEEALACFQRILEEQPGHLPAHRAIVRVCRAVEDWRGLGEALRALLGAGAAVLPPDELSKILSELGEVEGDKLGHPERAIECWRDVLDLDPTNARALAALEALLTAGGRWEEAVAVLHARGEATEEPADKVEVLFRAADLMEHKVADPARAAGIYERILELDPASLDASRRLEGILRARGEWERVNELLFARVDHARGAKERIETLREMARVYEEKLGQPEAAFVALQAAFKEDFTDDDVSAELERVTTATGKWADLLTDFTTLVRTIGDRRKAADLWARIGRWYGEQLGHVEYALASLTQALNLIPEHPGALAGIGALHRREGRFAELAQVLSRQAEAEQDPRRKAATYLRLADLYEVQLADPPGALKAYRLAAQADAHSLEALDALDRLYRRFQTWDQLVDVVARKAALLKERGAPAGQIAALGRQVGELWEEKLGSSTRAIEAYHEVLAADARDKVALRALERLYDKTDQADLYLEMLEKQLEVAGDAGERGALLLRMAATWDEKLHRLDRAAECLEQVLAIDERSDAAYRALERIYAQDRTFEKVADALRRHIRVVHDPGDRIDLYLELGRVAEEELRDFAAAIEAYGEALQIDPEHVGALQSLMRLHERMERWDDMARVAGKLTELVHEPGQRVELCYRLGRLSELQMRDFATAEARYAQALELDPSHGPSMLALANIYKGRGDWLKALTLYTRAEPFSQNLLEKTRLLYEAAEISDDKLGDHPRAVALFARVLEVDPDHVPAAGRLAEAYFAERRWAELEPVLDLLVRRSEGAAASDALATLYYRTGRCAQELGHAERALRYYKLAAELDGEHLPTLRGLAELLYRGDDVDGAYRAYQTMLANHREAIPDGEAVEVYYRLGTIKARQGDKKRALALFGQALTIEPAHHATLEAVVALQRDEGDWEAVAAAKRALAVKAPAERQFELLEEVGDVYREKLGNLPAALEVYREALALRADDLGVLHKLALDVHPELKQWDQVVEVVGRIAGLQSEPAIRGKYHYHVAVTFRDELHDPEQAIGFFNKALDAYFEKPGPIAPETLATHLKAFEAIDRMLTQAKDWQQAQRQYRKMLHRVLPREGLDVLKVTLWHALGEIYRTRLREYDKAIQCFEQAALLDPDNELRHQILAELYQVAGPQFADKAVREHQILIRRQPGRIDSYRALFRIYIETRQYDKAWCLAATLAFLKKADPTEAQFFEQYKPPQWVRARNKLTDELWLRAVPHPDEDRMIAAMLALLAWPFYALRARPAKELGLKANQRRDYTSDPLQFSRVFSDVHALLNVQPIDLYLITDRAFGIQMVRTAPLPSFVVGQDMLHGKTQRELAFAIAKELAHLRPENLLRHPNVCGAAGQLALILKAGIKAVSPGTVVKLEGNPEFDALVNHFKTTFVTEPARGEQLALLVQKYLAGKPDMDLTRWLAAGELSLHRIALSACNDLDVACRLASQEPASAWSAKDKVQALLLFNVSEEHFAIRAHLGIGVGQG